MIRSILPIANNMIHPEWCDHCKKKCDAIRKPYLISSTEKDAGEMVLCKCCMDLALNEQGILPDNF